MRIWFEISRNFLLTYSARAVYVSIVPRGRVQVGERVGSMRGGWGHKPGGDIIWGEDTSQ